MSTSPGTGAHGVTMAEAGEQNARAAPSPTAPGTRGESLVGKPHIGDVFVILARCCSDST